jgi:ubiquinone/menaquinone biosynthesis C-methylase UbiE
MTSVFVYDKTDINESYDKARDLPQQTQELWAEKFKRHIPTKHITTICDLGCGTGRFAVILAKNFSAKVIGIDPSEKMLTEARKNISMKTILFVRGSAESIPLTDNSVDMLFLSMVFHHIQDRRKAILEFKRIFKSNRFICIRTSTKQSLQTYPWLQFFPSAMKIETNRAPDREELTKFFKLNAFGLKHHSKVYQFFAENHMQYLHKISTRGLSSLKAIKDDEFNTGLIRLEEYCRGPKKEKPIFEEIDFYVFSSNV